MPKDDDANFIADAWRWNNGRAKDDKDFLPLYGAPGDGLSRYEEYRGFMVQGEHIRTNPNEKDVFILDKAGLGIGAFGQTGLKIHFINPDEQLQGQINFLNKTAHIYTQFVIRIVKDEITRKVRIKVIPEKGVVEIEPILGECFPSLGAGGSPLVTIYTGTIREYIPGFFEQAVYATLSHELGHAVSMWECLWDIKCYMWPQCVVKLPPGYYYFTRILLLELPLSNTTQAIRGDKDECQRERSVKASFRGWGRAVNVEHGLGPNSPPRSPSCQSFRRWPLRSKISPRLDWKALAEVG